MDRWIGIDSFCAERIGKLLTIRLTSLDEKSVTTGELVKIWPDCLQIKWGAGKADMLVMKQSIATVREAAKPEVSTLRVSQL